MNGTHTWIERLNRLTAVVLGCVTTAVTQGRPWEGAREVAEAGYEGCIELSNATTRVVLEPNLGGRVLRYSLNGVEALHQDARFDGATRATLPQVGGIPGGRFDVGPELLRRGTPEWWNGAWRAEMTGDRAARLTSGIDPATGLQVIREFKLAAGSSVLECKQTIVNQGAVTQAAWHWSRTLAAGGGIGVFPLNPLSRYPLGYLVYAPGPVLQLRPPEDPNLQRHQGALILTGPPAFPKLAIDANEGWLGYLVPTGILFTKRFPVHPERAYGEPAGNSISTWYAEESRGCELEPIGPREVIAPDESASFTEEWRLHPFPFPSSREQIDVAKIRALATEDESR